MLEVSIVDYRPSFYGQVYHMLRDSINEEWRREYTRSNPARTRFRRCYLAVAAFAAAAAAYNNTSGGLPLVILVTLSGFLLLMESLLATLVWMDHGQWFMWREFEKDMCDRALANFALPPNRFFVATVNNDSGGKNSDLIGSSSSSSSEAVVVGCVGLFRTSKEVGRLRRLAVHPSMRRRGLGRKLGEKVAEAARTDGYRKLEVYTTSSRVSGLSLYRSLGFRAAGEKAESTLWFGGRVDMSAVHGIRMLRMEMDLPRDAGS